MDRDDSADYANGHLYQAHNQIQSQELKEMVSSPPNWPVRWGLTIFFLIAVILVIARWLISSRS